MDGMDLILYYINLYGYLGLWLVLAISIMGFPMPDESLLTFVGFLSSTGDLSYFWTVVSAALGSITGITIAYLLGRFFEPYVLRYLHRHTGVVRLEKVLRWYRLHGGKLLTIGYFIPGVRHLSGYVAGLSGFRYRTFAIYAYVGAVLWTTLFITLGRILGENWEQILASIQRYALVLGIVAALILSLLYLGYRNHRRWRAWLMTKILTIKSRKSP